MPFGRLVKEKLENGLNILFDIRDLIVAVNEARVPGKDAIGKLITLLNCDLSKGNADPEYVIPYDYKVDFLATGSRQRNFKRK